MRALTIACLLLTGAKAFARATPDYTGFIKVSPDKKIFTRVWHGADNKRPPVVLLNGLTQDTDHWKRFIPELVANGTTVIAFDFFHQGRSLDEYVKENHLSLQTLTRPIVPPLLGEKYFWAGREPLLPEVSAKDQARILETLLTKLGVKGPAHIVGLSYGGAIALQFGASFPNRLASLSLFAPYVQPMAAQDDLIRMLMAHYRRMFPNQPVNEDELYDYFLRILVIYAYHLSEPSILKWGSWQPFAASEMIRGVRKLNAEALAQRLPAGILNLVIAGRDAYIPEKQLRDFWESVPDSAKGSLLKIEDVEHKMNESVGPFIAAWIQKIVEGDTNISNGREFLGFPREGFVESTDGQTRIELPKTAICENLLRPTNPNHPNLPVDRIVRYPGEDFLDRFMPQEWKDLFQKVVRFFWGL